MKVRLPLTEREETRLYWELSTRGAYCTGYRYHWRHKINSEEEFISLAMTQSRFDPRLLAILIDYFVKTRPELNPVELKQILRQQGALQVAAVIGEYVNQLSPSEGIRDLFEFLASGVSPLPFQLFYRGLYPVAGRKMEEAAAKPLWAFKKWGFLATDPPLLKDRIGGNRPYLFDPTSRLGILRELIRERRSFRLRDYLDKLHHSISRQQALLDLKQIPGITKMGDRRGTCYIHA